MHRRQHEIGVGGRAQQELTGVDALEPVLLEHLAELPHEHPAALNRLAPRLGRPEVGLGLDERARLGQDGADDGGQDTEARAEPEEDAPAAAVLLGIVGDEREVDDGGEKLEGLKAERTSVGKKRVTRSTR